MEDNSQKLFLLQVKHSHTSQPLQDQVPILQRNQRIEITELVGREIDVLNKRRIQINRSRRPLNFGLNLAEIHLFS